MKKEYGVEYTDAEAHEAATNLVGYFEVLMKMDYEQKQKANKKLSKKELFFRSMNVGKDHISSMVNTLVLVYAGASLPLLLLFVNNPHPFLEVINYEIIADEIVRTLVGSIGLILAVPITTYIAVQTSKIGTLKTN